MVQVQYNTQCRYSKVVQGVVQVHRPGMALEIPLLCLVYSGGQIKVCSAERSDKWSVQFSVQCSEQCSAECSVQCAVQNVYCAVCSEECVLCSADYVLCSAVQWRGQEAAPGLQSTWP